MNVCSVLNFSFTLADVISKLFNLPVVVELIKVKLALTDELKLLIDATLPLNVVAIEELIEDDINVCDADNEELIIETSISVAITDRELLNDELTVLIIDWEIDELNDVKFELWVANVCATDALKSPLTLWTDALNKLKLVLTDELKFVTDNKLPLNVDAIDELIEDDIKACDDDIDALTTATSKSVAITDRELLNDALTLLIIDVDNELLNDAVYEWNDPVVKNPTAVKDELTIVVIDDDKFVFIDVTTAVSTACVKLPPDALTAAPTFTAADSSLLPSICFNLIKFAISYKYLSLF